MKVEIFPREDLRTTLPITVTVKGIEKAPKIEVKELGTLPVRKKGTNFQSEFWAQDPGQYTVIVKGSELTVQKTVDIQQQRYISFKNEFGFFLILLLLSSLGMIRWIKKIKQKTS